MVWRPRLRTILLLVNVVILCLPLYGIAVLRIYESALIRQTESELIAQGVFIAATYRTTLVRITAEAPEGAFYPHHYGLPVASKWRRPETVDERWWPRPAVLDLATERIRPPQPEPFLSVVASDPWALAVGRELTPILRDAQVVTLAGIRVVDFFGNIIASTGETLSLSLAHSEEVARALLGEPVSLLRRRLVEQPPPSLDSISRGSHIRVFVATPIVQNNRVLGAVVLSRTPNTIIRALYGKRYLLLYLALSLLAVVSLISVLVSLTISRPVYALIAQAERAVRGEIGAVAPLTGPMTQEIARLSETVAVLARTLEQRADYIRTFAAHVSHEFKTPLAAIQGAVELLRDHVETMSQGERERFLGNLAADAARLERLVKRLLELARADVMTAGTETADVAKVIDNVVTRQGRQGLSIRIERKTDIPAVAMAEETLDAILSNLIDNARQHGGEGVAVTLRVLMPSGLCPSAMDIIVEDNGSGISPANARRIFEPFFTTSRKQGGTGLGLAVVRSLLVAHGGRIQLNSSDKGAVFRLTLPVADE